MYIYYRYYCPPHVFLINNSMILGNKGVNTTIFSLTALTDPGSVAINVSLRTPTTGRDSNANGVCFSPSCINAWAIAGASLWNNGLIASGVKSRAPNPVPPLVNIKSTVDGLLVLVLVLVLELVLVLSPVSVVSVVSVPSHHLCTIF